MTHIATRSSLDKEAAHNMSRMVKHLISVSALILPVAAFAATQQEPKVEWRSGTGNAETVTVPRAQYDRSEGNIPAALQRWKMLSQSGNYSFSEYASFLLTYPDWPESDTMRKNAEQAIDLLSYSPNQAVAFFDRLPPLSNSGRAKYAIALYATGNKEKAETWARKAWREGPLTDDDETRISQMIGSKLTADDNDARVERLLWSGGTLAAQRVMPMTSPQRRPVLAAWLATKTKSPDAAVKISQAGGAANTEAGLLAERATQMRLVGNSFAARELLASRGNLSVPPSVPKEWYKLLLTHATAAATDGQYDVAYRIASRVDDGLAAGLNVSDQDLTTRDQYTSLTWLAGQLAMDRLGHPKDAVGMFQRYANAAKSPQTRSKGLYWAGKASAKAGDTLAAKQFYSGAGAYYDYFYGQLALEALGQPLPQTAAAITLPPAGVSTTGNSASLAARLAAKYGGWKDQSTFLRTIAKAPTTPEEYLSTVSLSQSLNRPDLAVMAGRNARLKGFDTIIRYGFPTVNVPASEQDNWTLIHAISRQESQFDRAIVSHAGARGLMQLMPGTARETSGKIAMSYRPDALTTDTDYNIQLGSTYIKRMLSYYNGSYPLAVAAYNAGPGNVNKWLAANGDPRSGQISVIDWIEKIPLFETRDYVQRVLENAVMYDHLNPDKSRNRGTNPLSSYLGKTIPG
jgi:soluble lytic murein transglycosylase